MEAILINAGRISISMVLFYLLYWLFLRKETFFNMNRYYLVFSLLASVLVVAFPIRYSVFVEGAAPVRFLSGLRDFSSPVSSEMIKPVQQTNAWPLVLAGVYLLGVLVFMLRLLLQGWSISRLIQSNNVRKINGMSVVLNEKYEIPFSFFRWIFVHPKIEQQAGFADILAHERVHVVQRHWIDLLVVELLTVVFWFNPVIWLFEHSIKQNHEYLADQGALARGSDLSRYQALLINQLMGLQVVGVASNLTFSLNTNRLKMMTKNSSGKINLVKFALVLPLVCTLMAAFARPVYVSKPVDANLPVATEPVSLNSEADLQPAVVVEAVVESPAEKKWTIRGKVVKEADGSPLQGASVIIQGTTIGALTDENGRFTLEDINPEMDYTDKANPSYAAELFISFVGYETNFGKVSASKKQIDSGKGSYTFKLKRAVIAIDTDESKVGEVPPPPPPPAAVFANKNGDEPVFFVVEELPTYPQGHYGLMQHYKKAKQKIKEQSFFEGKSPKGKALVGFTVNESGEVVNITVLEKDNDMVANAGVEIVKLMEKWSPGKQRGKAVPVDFAIPIQF